MEEFRITKCSKYTITNEGRLFKNFKGIYVETKTNLNNKGYKVYDGFNLVHRLVATMFINNPSNNPVVNHIDGNKLNNFVSNLEWCTHQENVRHSWALGLSKKSELTGVPKREIICVQTQQIFKSISEASLIMNIKTSNISHALKSKLKSGGYNWDYINITEKDNDYIYIKSLR